MAEIDSKSPLIVISSSFDDDDDDKTKIKKVLCAKREDDIKRFEETEDCFILDFNPFDPVDISKLSLDCSDTLDQTGIAVLAEKCQVACRDYPHPRFLCQKFPFATTPHRDYCGKCYCYVCDVVAPCECWDLPMLGQHCDATNELWWNSMRKQMKEVDIN